MKADAISITLMACGSVIAVVAVIYLWGHCIGGNKKQTGRSTMMQSVMPPPAAQRAYCDVERGAGTNHQRNNITRNGTKDGGMVILVGAGAAFATAAVAAAVTNDVDGDGGGSACGGNDGGACGGCTGGGCGGCGGD
ncbi:hypothetical protein D8674_025809 [Pyrus ussuriensis x Pyrus communis]|uniref:Loricrin-like n=1 Tax=Pyrus ussuriensis x Pyrus communis TaxID=2448454 RepID=A0A5N5I501_9ROSA|nr:hypothetical protein D8674_025809 [Pyrus ussuriensis x Pyrus communis]